MSARTCVMARLGRGIGYKWRFNGAGAQARSATDVNGDGRQRDRGGGNSYVPEYVASRCRCDAANVKLV